MTGAELGMSRRQRSGLLAGEHGPRLGLALLVTLLGHVLMLGLVFSGHGLGLPGLGLPQSDRRAEAREVRVTVLPAKALPTPPLGLPAAVPAPAALSPGPGSIQDKVRSDVSNAPAEAAPAAPALQMPAVAPPHTEVASAALPTPAAVPLPELPAPAAQPIVAPEASSRLGTLPQGIAQAPSKAPMPVIAADRPELRTWTVPSAPAVDITALADAPRPSAPGASGPERALPAARAVAGPALARIDPLVREAALNLAALDTSAQDAQRQLSRLQATSAETARVAAERERTAERERATEREQAVRQEAARLEALRLAAERDELARQAAARAELAQLRAAQDEAVRLAAAREAAAQQEAAQQSAARQDAARARAAQAEADDARREASRRAMGRQLDEEAAQRRAAETAAAAAALPLGADTSATRQVTPLPLSWSSARRGRLLGRTDTNAELVLYAEAWARKIQLNTSIDEVRAAAQQRHGGALVTVAIRQDGSVESVNFVTSSGVPQLDEAIRRIVQRHAPYPAFAPALARDFDVIEIRRSWSFDTAVRMH